HFLDAVNYIERGSVAQLQDGHQRRASAIHPDDVGLRHEAIAHISDVVNVDCRVADGFDRQVIHLRHGFWRSVHVHLVFKRALLGRARGKNQVLQLMVLTTSRGETLFDGMAAVFRSTMTVRCFPPYGYGMATPFTVTSCVRMKFCPMSAN